MSSVALMAARRRLDAAFARVAKVGSQDLELQSDYAKYLCVLVSGYVEVALAILAGEHCRARAAPTVHAYAVRELQRIQNVKCERLLQVLGAFDAGWRVDGAAFLKDRRKDAVDSVVNLRNKIAHGETVTVTLAQVREYYESVTELIAFLEVKFQ